MLMGHANEIMFFLDRQQLSISISPTSKKSSSSTTMLQRLQAPEEELSEGRRNLAVVVKKLREFSSRYPYARGISELYTGCLEMIESKLDESNRVSINILQKAVSILEATDLRFFDARARYIIGSHSGFGDERDHDMLVDARQHFSLNQYQHYLQLVDDALQRQPLVDLFARNRFKRDMVLPDVVCDAVAGAFAMRPNFPPTRTTKNDAESNNNTRLLNGSKSDTVSASTDEI
jgi:hypothetical protein